MSGFDSDAVRGRVSSGMLLAGRVRVVKEAIRQKHNRISLTESSCRARLVGGMMKISWEQLCDTQSYVSGKETP